MKLKRNKIINALGIAISFSLLAATSCFADSFASSTDSGFQHVVWNTYPIPVDLQVGQQRIIQFPDPVQYRFVPGSNIDSSAISFINANNTLYVTANQPFNTVQLEVKDTVTNSIVILDLTGTASPVMNTPLSVVLQNGNAPAAQSGSGATNTLNPLMSNANSDSPSNYLIFSRYVENILYPPVFNQTSTGNYSRYPMGLTAHSVSFFIDPAVQAYPEGEWTDGYIYATVLVLRNQSKEPITLDQRLYQGNWLFATTFPIYTLQPVGSLGNQTQVVVLSRDPFVKALQEPSFMTGLMQNMNLLGGGQ